MPRRALLSTVAVLMVLTSGCLGSVQPAEVPATSLDEHGWETKRQDERSVAGGLGEQVILSYGPSGTEDAGVTTVSANDVPILDESTLLPTLIEVVEKRQGVELEESGQREVELTNLGATVNATEYDVQGAPADAKALVFTAPCPSFAAVLAWGTAEGSGGLTGGEAAGGYDEALEVVRTVTC